MAFQVAVCGSRSCTEADRSNAYRVGELLAQQGAVLVTGAGTGVMAAVAAGARARDGVVVGIRPDDTRGSASDDLSVTIVTNMGEARNVVIVLSADAVISVGGSWGTLSEVALAAQRRSIPVVALGGWKVVGPDGGLVPGVRYADSPEQAVLMATGRE